MTFHVMRMKTCRFGH